MLNFDFLEKGLEGVFLLKTVFATFSVWFSEENISHVIYF